MTAFKENMFTEFNLTEDEQLEGSKLTVTQKQVIQNMLSAIALQKVTLDMDTDNPSKFAQSEAYLKGQMDILTFILDADRAAKEHEKDLNN